ncbi:MAG TPA: CHASE sensor domain-containing protein [Verrucomicrobiae bacterium]|jgi:signal transduction histidine kinase/ActR/RegA family two-component response regulator/HAMP domain-containing protein|nr:CHASE sensor domain-containing protein [Verrucomicrobiae bacterium]
MSWLRDIPLKRKLTLVILLTCSSALLCACVVLGGYQMIDFRKNMKRDTVVLADVLAKNVRAALTFEDENAAHETLLALQSEPNVSGACLYDIDGNPFAEYSRSGETIQFPEKPEPDNTRFRDGHLRIFRPVNLNTKRVGTLYIQAELQGLHNRLILFIGIAILVLLASCLVAILVASRLRRPIVEPILGLTETAREIADRKDYSIRVPSQGRNEIGLLTDAFNQLLNSIEERNSALRGANAALLQEVTERKGAENRVIAQLARLEMLHRITRAIGERQDLQSIFQVVIRTLEEHLPIDFCCVCVYEPAANQLIVTSVGIRSEATAMELAMTEQARVAIDQNGLSRCVRGNLVYEPDIVDSQFPFPQRLARGGLRALVAAPLLVESQVFGVLIAARRQPESFSSGECEFLRQLSEHVALAAHQSQLHMALQQAYDDLRQTQQAIMQQERLRALGQMASGIAHDINNAISPVALYTESLLETEPNLSQRAREYLTTIQSAIEDVSHTVARMREFYRQRETQLTLTPVQLNQMLNQVVDLSRARWSDMPQQRGININIKTELAENLPVVMGVESEIREALVNLIFNSVDAMPQGGTLTLRTRVSEPVPAGTPLVIVEVEDTGVGMDEDTRRRCLEPFFTTKGERGTGLGLAMVYGIIRRHGAEIEIDSVIGKGTTMRISFPAADLAKSNAAAVNTTFTVPTRLRVLVVDDDPLLIKSLRDILETDGHLVVTANGGQAGIEAFSAALERKEPFAVVLTDLGMPYVDGRQVAAAIKAASAWTPVILLTGWGQRLVAEGDVPPNVDRVLNKPPKLRDLREALAQVMPTLNS